MPRILGEVRKGFNRRWPLPRPVPPENASSGRSSVTNEAMQQSRSSWKRSLSSGQPSFDFPDPPYLSCVLLMSTFPILHLSVTWGRRGQTILRERARDDGRSAGEEAGGIPRCLCVDYEVKGGGSRGNGTQVVSMYPRE